MKLFFLVPSLQVFLEVEQILDIFVVDVGSGALLLADFVDLIAVEVGLRASVLVVEHAMESIGVVLGHASINII